MRRLEARCKVAGSLGTVVGRVGRAAGDESTSGGAPGKGALEAGEVALRGPLLMTEVMAFAETGVRHACVSHRGRDSPACSETQGP